MTGNIIYIYRLHTFLNLIILSTELFCIILFFTLQCSCNILSFTYHVKSIDFATKILNKKWEVVKPRTAAGSTSSLVRRVNLKSSSLV